MVLEADRNALGFWVDTLLHTLSNIISYMHCCRCYLLMCQAGSILARCMEKLEWWIIIVFYSWRTCANTNENAKHPGYLLFSLTWNNPPIVSAESRIANCPLGDVKALNQLKMVTPLEWAHRKKYATLFTKQELGNCQHCDSFLPYCIV